MRKMSTKKNGILLAGMIGLAAIAAPVPAPAGGSISVVITPRGEEAQVLRNALAIYSIVDALKTSRKNSARVLQRGQGNAAAIQQQGSGNFGLVVQNGRDHSASLTQQGRNNSFGIIQLGRGAQMNAAQAGDGQFGLVVQAGW
jgi:hypothetical protein